jgi:hypothetical protein
MKWNKLIFSEITHSEATQKCVKAMIELDKEFSEFITKHQAKCETALKATEEQIKKKFGTQKPSR